MKEIICEGCGQYESDCRCNAVPMRGEMGIEKYAENVCCPELVVVDCADTDEHKHLVCSYSGAILDNETVIDICIRDHSKCVLKGKLKDGQ